MIINEKTIKLLIRESISKLLNEVYLNYPEKKPKWDPIRPHAHIQNKKVKKDLIAKIMSNLDLDFNNQKDEIIKFAENGFIMHTQVDYKDKHLYPLVEKFYQNEVYKKAILYFYDKFTRIFELHVSNRSNIDKMFLSRRGFFDKLRNIANAIAKAQISYTRHTGVKDPVSGTWQKKDNVAIFNGVAMEIASQIPYIFKQKLDIAISEVEKENPQLAKYKKTKVDGKEIIEYDPDNVIKKIKKHKLQRDTKRRYVEKNKELLKNTKVVHYPYAFAQFEKLFKVPAYTKALKSVGITKNDVTLAHIPVDDPLYSFMAFNRIIAFVKQIGGNINQRSRDEIAGVFYPKDYPEINDAISAGTEKGGYHPFPYLGFELDGFVTYVGGRDVQSSTFGSSVSGGARKSSGFVRYPFDIVDKFMGAKNKEAYISQVDLKDLIGSFDQHVGAQTYAEELFDLDDPEIAKRVEAVTPEYDPDEYKAAGRVFADFLIDKGIPTRKAQGKELKANYGEAFIDNWKINSVVGDFDKMIKVAEEQKELMTSRYDSRLKEITNDKYLDTERAVHRFKLGVKWRLAVFMTIIADLEQNKNLIDIKAKNKNLQPAKIIRYVDKLISIISEASSDLSLKIKKNK